MKVVKVVPIKLLKSQTTKNAMFQKLEKLLAFPKCPP